MAANKRSRHEQIVDLSQQQQETNRHLRLGLSQNRSNRQQILLSSSPMHTITSLTTLPRVTRLHFVLCNCTTAAHSRTHRRPHFFFHFHAQNDNRNATAYGLRLPIQLSPTLPACHLVHSSVIASIPPSALALVLVPLRYAPPPPAYPSARNSPAAPLEI